MPTDMHQAKPEWHTLLFFQIEVTEGYTAASARNLGFSTWAVGSLIYRDNESAPFDPGVIGAAQNHSWLHFVSHIKTRLPQE